MVFILDRSGSMSGLEADTIGGYNSLLENREKKLAMQIKKVIGTLMKFELSH